MQKTSVMYNMDVTEQLGQDNGQGKDSHIGGKTFSRNSKRHCTKRNQYQNYATLYGRTMCQYKAHDNQLMFRCPKNLDMCLVDLCSICWLMFYRLD